MPTLEELTVATMKNFFMKGVEGEEGQEVEEEGIVLECLVLHRAHNLVAKHKVEVHRGWIWMI